MKKTVCIYVFRHGISQYRQGKVNIIEANDLTKEGIEGVISNTSEIVLDDFRTREIIIYSSPYGRALHTAKIIACVFQTKGITAKIYVRDELQEVKNFSWPLFESLLHGGRVNFQGTIFQIEKKQSNPKNLDYREYYTGNYFLRIDNEILALWPPEFASTIKNIEVSESATQRLSSFLACIRDNPLTATGEEIIIVTHDALIGRLVELSSRGLEKDVSPGGWVKILIDPENLIISFKDYQRVEIKLSNFVPQ